MSTSESPDCEASTKPGRIGWAELITSDPAGAIAYYTQMFGWETEPFPNSPVGYMIFKHDGMAFGGVMAAPTPNVPTHWVNYVIVADVDAMVSKSAQLGAQICMEPMDIPGVGRIAVVKDPQGAVIGLHQFA